MAEETAHEIAGFRGMAEEAFEALGDCFRGDRLLAAGVGIGGALVLAGAVGTAATTSLLRNALAPAAMLGILAGFLVHAGLLVTYGALARMAMAARHGARITPGQAFAFAGLRSHILIGVPLFTLVVALGAGSLAGYVGAAMSASQSLGSALAPLALILLFALNVALVGAVLLSHCLTAPCVACLDPSFATVASRLVQIAQERRGSFLGYQAASVVVGLPLMALTTGLFLAAFQPALQVTAAGRAKATLMQQAAEPAPSRPPTGRGAEEGSRDWVEVLRGWAGRASEIGGAPLASAAAVLALLLGVFPLIYAASVESAIYIGLTGDRFLAMPEAAPGEAAAGTAPGKRPPIAHCWRCDAINRLEAPKCSKCGATLVVCPHCFGTNEPERVSCSSCGRTLVPELDPEVTVVADGGKHG